jgi:hypothetical protein
MVVAIIDTATKGWTLAEVMLLQGHNMNTLAAIDTTRVFSDDMICTTINNVIRWVYGNSYEDMNDHMELCVVNTLAVIALNNLMHEAGYLPTWVAQDPFDKVRFYQMVEQVKSDETGVDILPLYRGQFHEVI